MPRRGTGTEPVKTVGAYPFQRYQFRYVDLNVLVSGWRIPFFGSLGDMSKMVSSELMLAVGKIRTMVTAWLKYYEAYGDRGYEMFKAEWTFGRLIISLQARLIVEQFLWERGKDFPAWRRLVTGFKPVTE